ncbi:MAG: phosphate uptake regulator PhoU [Sulfolobales archaeon]
MMASMIRDLDILRNIITRMTQHAVRSVEITKTLFTTSDLNLRKDVWMEVDAISKILNTLREEVINEVLSFIVRYQPLGRELRIARMLINVAYDIYRISRYCREVARIDSMLSPENGVSVISGFEKIFDEILKALNAAFADLSELTVRREGIVKEVDDLVDLEYMKVLKEIVSSPTVSRENAVKTLLMRHAERIVDHAQYIENYVKELQS